MCEEVMWKKGRGAAKYKYKYVWRSDVEKGRGAAKSRKGDDMRPPLRLHNLNDWETDRGLSWIILRPIAEYVESSEINLPGLSKTLANTSSPTKFRKFKVLTSLELDTGQQWK